jgi:hypothetical protein
MHMRTRMRGLAAAGCAAAAAAATRPQLSGMTGVGYHLERAVENLPNFAHEQYMRLDGTCLAFVGCAAAAAPATRLQLSASYCALLCDDSVSLRCPSPRPSATADSMCHRTASHCAGARDCLFSHRRTRPRTPRRTSTAPAARRATRAAGAPYSCCCRQRRPAW